MLKCCFGSVSRSEVSCPPILSSCRTTEWTSSWGSSGTTPAWPTASIPTTRWIWTRPCWTPSGSRICSLLMRRAPTSTRSPRTTSCCASPKMATCCTAYGKQKARSQVQSSDRLFHRSHWNGDFMKVWAWKTSGKFCRLWVQATFPFPWQPVGWALRNKHGCELVWIDSNPRERTTWIAINITWGSVD